MNKQKTKQILIITLLFVLAVSLFLASKSLSNRKIKLDNVVIKKLNKNNIFAMYKKVGDEYVPYTDSDSWPEGYKLNLTKSVCTNNNGDIVENVLSFENGEVIASTNESINCWLYFDETNYLASVMSEDNSLMTEYKGEGWVGDTNPYFTNHIYHWYATDTTSANTVKDSWNVVFGGYCWQMIRTTENGGVKLLYNGEPIVGTDQETGEPTYDCSDVNRKDILHVGISGARANQTGFSSSTSWKYGSGYTVSGTNITLTDTIDSTWSETNYNNNNLKGKYTCKNNTGTCTTMYLIDDYNTTTSAWAYPMTASIPYNMIGNSPLNSSINSPAYAGYMYNDNTAHVRNNMAFALQYNIGTTTTIYTRQTFSDNTYFSDTVPTWGGNYTALTSPQRASALKTQEGCSDYSCLVGKYTFNQTGTGTGSTVYYVVAVDGTNKYMYVRSAKYGRIPSNANHTNYVIGTNITDNLDGTYTITGTSNYDITTWSSSALSPAPSNSQYYYMCADGVSTTCSYGVVRFIYSNYATYFNVYYLSNNIYGTYKTGTQVTDNGNGTYTLGGTTSEIVAVNWYRQYSNADNKYICLNGELTCTNIYYVKLGRDTSFYYYSPNTNYKLSNTISYSGGTYTLDMSDENAIETWNDFYTSESGTPTFTTLPTKIGKAHYVCLDSSNNLQSNTTSCSKVGYIYYLSGTTAYFMPLSNGEYISTDTSSTSGMTKWADNNNLLYRMLYADNVNTKDSNAKQAIDTWYKQNILGKPFETKIDSKEIYCGDRSISNFGSWNSNATDMTSYLYFSGLGSKTVSINNSNATVYNLSCPNKMDAYSKDATTKGNGDLTYPVGLISRPEMINLGSNTVRTYTDKNMIYYWFGSPDFYNFDGAIGVYVYSSGSLSNRSVNNAFGLRPSIALTSDAEFTSGDGSMLNPYVVDET